MELKWIEDFVCLAANRSFSRSSDLRGISQPAFSRRIKRLEEWLGVSLFKRDSQPVELTDAGRDFLITAQNVIEAFYSSREALRSVHGSENETLVFVALSTLAMTSFPTWLSQLQDQLGEFPTRLLPDRGGIEANTRSLLDGEVDFLMTYFHPWVPLSLDERKFAYRVIGKETVLPVVCPDSFSPNEIDDAIANERPISFVGYGDRSFFDVALSRLFEQRPQLMRKTVHQNTMSAGLKSMAMAGWGVAWLPERLIATELAHRQLVVATQDSGWHMEAEIRLYRDLIPRKRKAELIWNTLSEATESG